MRKMVMVVVMTLAMGAGAQAQEQSSGGIVKQLSDKSNDASRKYREWAKGRYKGKVKLQSGSLGVLSENATAKFEMDYSTTTFDDGDEEYKTWCGKDYEERVSISYDAFVHELNETSKGLKISAAGGEKYLMKFKVKDIEKKVATGWWGQMAFRVTGDIEVTDASTGASVCKMEVDVRGDADMVPSDAIGSAFTAIVKAMLKAK
ncbi:MAG: hypothetical protein II951_03810 [Bacteroidales bacterium]|nr:hypothetical protein [Bacteroidales bacterium]